MPSSRNAVVLVVISFILVILIYSSVSMHVVFADITRGPISCVEGKGPFGLYACCQKETDSEGIEITWCTVCDKYTHTNCSPRFQIRPSNPQQPGTLPPSSAGLVNNAPSPTSTFNNPTTGNITNPSNNNNVITSTPPVLGITKEHNLVSPKLYSPSSPLKQQTLTTTCPNGLPPDINGSCPSTPTTNTNQQSGLTSNNNNPQQGHHHKGSNNQPTQTGAGGGQELTATKKHKGSKTDEGTTVQPSS